MRQPGRSELWLPDRSDPSCRRMQGSLARRYPRLFSRKLVLSVSELGIARRIIRSPRVYRGLVRRFVAADTLEEALRALAGLRDQRMSVTLDYLGEKVTDRPLARKVVEEYKRALTGGLPTVDGLDGNVSLKPSQLGMDIDPGYCLDNVTEVVDCARTAGSRLVRIDMEDSPYVDRTIELYEGIRDAGYDNVGTVLQAYLHRSPGDLERLMERGAAIRLCKGAYDERADVAIQRMPEIRQAYLALADTMLAGNCRPAFATHDDRLIAELRRRVKGLARPSNTFEFQMLYGINRELQRRLVREGYAVRVYVPYGAEWYAYFSRRIAERPENLWFMLRYLVRD